jgi:transcriptional regulator with XRE-family HTH domain
MPSPLNAELGRRIRSRRDELSHTQAWLGRHVGLSRTAITNIECGRQRLLVYQLFAIATALATTPEALLPSIQVVSEVGVVTSNVSDDMPTVASWLSQLTLEQ